MAEISIVNASDMGTQDKKPEEDQGPMAPSEDKPSIAILTFLAGL